MGCMFTVLLFTYVFVFYPIQIYFDMFEIERRTAEEEASGNYLSQNALDNMYLESDNAVSSLLAGQDQM